MDNDIPQKPDDDDLDLADRRPHLSWVPTPQQIRRWAAQIRSERGDAVPVDDRAAEATEAVLGRSMRLQLKVGS